MLKNSTRLLPEDWKYAYVTVETHCAGNLAIFERLLAAISLEFA